MNQITFSIILMLQGGKRNNKTQKTSSGDFCLLFNSCQDQHSGRKISLMQNKRSEERRLEKLHSILNFECSRSRKKNHQVLSRQVDLNEVVSWCCLHWWRCHNPTGLENMNFVLNLQPKAISLRYHKAWYGWLENILNLSSEVSMGHVRNLAIV